MEQAASEQREIQDKRTLSSMPSDPQLYLSLIFGLLAVWIISAIMPPTALPAETLGWHYLQLLLLFPVLEEILFRGLLQGVLARQLPGGLGTLSYANLITSLLFATSHLYSQPAAWAAATFLPSLLFGYFRDRYQHLLPAVALHVAYNSAFFLMHAR